MLTIYDVTSASRAKEYFATSVSPEAVSTRQDYYSEGQEAPGRFGGTLTMRSKSSSLAERPESPIITRASGGVSVSEPPSMPVGLVSKWRRTSWTVCSSRL